MSKESAAPAGCSGGRVAEPLLYLPVTSTQGDDMKRATMIALAVAAYWVVRVVAAPTPSPQELPSTIEELQVMEATHLETTPLMEEQF